MTILKKKGKVRKVVRKRSKVDKSGVNNGGEGSIGMKEKEIVEEVEEVEKVEKGSKRGEGLTGRVSEIIREWARKKGVSIEKLPIKDAFWKVLDSLSLQEEEIFYRSVGRVLKMPFVEKEELRKGEFKIDEKKAKEEGGKKLREKGYLPLVGKAVLTCNPFLDYFLGECYLTTFTAFTEFFDRKQKEFLLVEEVEKGEFEAGKYLDSIFTLAFLQEASDIHIEYDAINDLSIVKLRVDGILEKVREIKGLEYHERLVNKIFEISGINVNDFIRIHDKRTQFDIAGHVIPVRVSAVPVNVRGERKVSNIVMRLLGGKGDVEKRGVNFLKLGFLENAINFLEEDVVNLPYGMVLLSGPTGSGKTTTLYNFLLRKREQPVKICTVEDPVEIQIPGITQVEIRDAKDEEDRITFSSAVRAFLRHDPDVMLIGEIRDRETAVEATRVALTGHLVFSTVHANTSLGVIIRLLDFGVERFILAETLKVIISQRLVRKICPYCKREVNLYDVKEVEKVFKKPYKIFEKRYKQLLDKMGKVYVGIGCKECNYKGYKGRTIIYEILPVTEGIVKALFEGKFLTEEEVFTERLLKFSFKEVAFEKIKRGETTIEEVERYIHLGELGIDE